MTHFGRLNTVTVSGRACNEFVWLNCDCRVAQASKELSENLLQNLFHNLPPQNVVNLAVINLRLTQTPCADLHQLELLLDLKNTVAVGEIGLDYSNRNHGKT